jgi:DNA-binding response OmpR family regulator
MMSEKIRLTHGPLTLDKTLRRAQLGPHVIDFTEKEFQLLWSLASDPGRVFYRDELMTKIWGRGVTVDERTVDAHIARVRRKLRAAAKYGCRIETIWGMGYKLADLAG